MAEIEDRNPEEIKRRKLLEDIAADRDDEDEDEEKSSIDKGKGPAVGDEYVPYFIHILVPTYYSDEEEDSDEEDDEDEPAALMRELEKIKRERAEEQARKEREAAQVDASRREEEIATANPLLNLQAALGKGGTSSVGGTFAVKKRWDDGEYFEACLWDIGLLNTPFRSYFQESSKWCLR